jgi:hypothetical protein
MTLVGAVPARSSKSVTENKKLGMNTRIIKERISKQELEELAKEFYVEMVKGVADIEREIIALGGEWHMDANQVLIEDGSNQENLWGFNVYVDKLNEKRLEYNSLINIRPKQKNRSMEVESEEIRNKIFNIVNNLVE